MTDYAWWEATRHRLERVWKEAEARARRAAAAGRFAADEEIVISREGGGRA